MDKTRYVPPEELTEAELLEKIEERFQHWDRLMVEGGTTPKAPDGGDLNLVRNHIIYYRYHLDQLRLATGQTSTTMEAMFPSANRPIPPEVPNCYMVRNGKYPDRVCRVLYPVLTHSMDLNRKNWKPEDVF